MDSSSNNMVAIILDILGILLVIVGGLVTYARSRSAVGVGLFMDWHCFASHLFDTFHMGHDEKTNDAKDVTKTLSKLIKNFLTLFLPLTNGKYFQETYL